MIFFLFKIAILFSHLCFAKELTNRRVKIKGSDKTNSKVLSQVSLIFDTNNSIHENNHGRTNRNLRTNKKSHQIEEMGDSVYRDTTPTRRLKKEKTVDSAKETTKRENEKNYEYGEPATATDTLLGAGCQYLYLQWFELPTIYQMAAKILGFNQNTWDNESTSELEALPWFQLKRSEQEAANMFGYSEKTWNLGSEYDDFYYADLPLEIQEAAMNLGYDEIKWDYGLPVDSENKSWYELSPEEQQGARVFGYDEKSWDELCMTATSNLPSDQPSMMPSHIPTVQ